MKNWKRKKIFSLILLSWFIFHEHDGSGELEKWLKRLNDPTATGFGRKSLLPVMFRENYCSMETEEKSWAGEFVRFSLSRERRKVFFENENARGKNHGKSDHGDFLFTSVDFSFSYNNLHNLWSFVSVNLPSAVELINVMLIHQSSHYQINPDPINSFFPTLKLIMWFLLVFPFAVCIWVCGKSTLTTKQSFWERTFIFLPFNKTCVLPRPTTTNTAKQHVQHV